MDKGKGYKNTEPGDGKISTIEKVLFTGEGYPARTQRDKGQGRR